MRLFVFVLNYFENRRPFVELPLRSACCGVPVITRRFLLQILLCQLYYYRQGLIAFFIFGY